jgi:hypothetical protein
VPFDLAWREVPQEGDGDDTTTLQACLSFAPNVHASFWLLSAGWLIDLR